MNTDIYYEVHGSGSALLLIPGGNGDAGFYEPLAKALAGEFTVVTYNRQGFSRSPLSAATDDRLASDIEDARRLLDSHSDGPAEVFGSSSGGIVALDLVLSTSRHRPHGGRARAAGGVSASDGKGTCAAMRKFTADAGVGPPRIGSPEFFRMLRLMPRIRHNLPFWLENELRQYTRFEPDLPSLRRISEQLVLAGVHDSHQQFPYRATAALADALETKAVDWAVTSDIARTQANSRADYADFWRRNDLGR